MLTLMKVDFTCDDPCRSALRAQIESIKEYSALPGLLKRNDVANTDAAWYVGYYDRMVVNGENFYGAVINAGGIDFVLPQGVLVQELNGKELTVDHGRFVVRSRG